MLGQMPALFCVHLGLKGNRKAFPYNTDKPLSELLETVCRTWGLNYDALSVTTMARPPYSHSPFLFAYQFQEGDQIQDFSVTIHQLGGVTDIVISEIGPLALRCYSIGFIP